MHPSSSFIRARKIPGSSSIEYSLKFVVVGEPKVGKTAIVERYCLNRFTENYKYTIGVDFRMKELDWAKEAKFIRIQLWDIGGQEQYAKATRVFYRGALGAVIVCDITRPYTLEKALEWKRDIDRNLEVPELYSSRGVPFPCILLANKTDLVPSPTVDVPVDSSRALSEELSTPLESMPSFSSYASGEILESTISDSPDSEPSSPVILSRQDLDRFCEEHGFLDWFPTSAKLNINIAGAFERLARSSLDLFPEQESNHSSRSDLVTIELKSSSSKTTLPPLSNSQSSSTSSLSKKGCRC